MTQEQYNALVARKVTRMKGSYDNAPPCDDSLLREKDLQEAICQYLNLRDIPFFRQRMDRRTTGTLGQPDFLCCIKGKFAAIECKVGPNVLTDEQKAVQERLLAAGGRYDVVHTLQEAIEAIQRNEP